MKKITILILCLILIGGGLLAWSIMKKPSVKAPKKVNNSNFNLPVQKTNMQNPKISSKKILMVIAFKNFKDEEYFGTRQALDKAKFNITVASDQLGIASGSSGGEINVDLTTNNVDINNYDAVVFIGGGGALEHLNNQASYKIIQETVRSGKLLAAICISPVILAKAGVLNGKNATVWTSPLDKSPAKILEEHGAHYINQPVVQDGNIITGNGPSAAQEFGKKIVQFLTSTSD